MHMQLKEKNWESAFEPELAEKWKKEKVYEFNKKADNVFSVDTPPPYPNADIHPGQTAHYMTIDMIARTERMLDRNVLFPIGYDRNGINIEQVVEKKYGKKLHEFDREEFIKLCRQEIDKIHNKIDESFRRVGMSCDFEHAYVTDSEEYRAVSQACFIEMWKKGLIFEDLRPNYYCPGCKTTIAEAEVAYKEVPSTMNYMTWKVAGTKEEISIGTTRPELLCACGAVLFNPVDERYSGLKGKKAVLPIYGKEVPILPHAAAKQDFGTGLVMICSYGDSTDVQLFRELKLKPTRAIDEKGKMTKDAGFLEGMYVKEARKKIIQKMLNEKIITKQEQTMHRTPTCERSGDPLEFISLKEWYVKQLEFADKVKKRANEMKFYPEKNKQILFDWIDGLTIDWPISRRRYYHTEIPLWYCKKCSKPFVPAAGPYYQPWKTNPPKSSKCSCGSTEFIGETRVFDTWMDSSISNLYILGYLRDDKFFKKSYPCTMRPQGKEIVRTWLYYTILKNEQLLNSKAFENVVITGLGMDESGKKMSKSKGNYIEPMPLVEKYSADAYRFWSAAETNVGEDFRLSEERIRGASKFLTKLWNVAKFVSSFEEKKKPKKLEPTDEWIFAELDKLIKECKEGYDNYNFFVPATKIRDFVWNVFASSYIEMAKTRAYAGDESALYTIHACLRTILELSAPITPFITDKIYRDVYDETVHKKKMPEADKKANGKFTELTFKLTEFNSNIWKQKKDKGLSLKDKFGAGIPEELAPFAKDLKDMHKLV